MGFTAWLVLLFFLLITITIFAIKNKAKIIGIITMIIMALGNKELRGVLENGD